MDCVILSEAHYKATFIVTANPLPDCMHVADGCQILVVFIPASTDQLLAVRNPEATLKSELAPFNVISVLTLVQG